MEYMEELKDIIVGLDQRIIAYKSRLQELQKKREKIDDEIATIKKYLELAETLYRVEVDKAKLASLSSQIVTAASGKWRRTLSKRSKKNYKLFKISHLKGGGES